jgi:uncharacterized protein (TIGR01777 family)
VDAWAEELEGAEVLINLAGRSVNCRYTEENRRQILDSRVDPTRALGLAIAQSQHPPRLWMNASTATIYRHSLDREMDELTGELGSAEGEPSTWRFSTDVATAWEQAFFEQPLAHTRRVALRTAVVMSPEHGGAFDILLALVRRGFGGSAASGEQFVSWIHAVDFVRAIEFLIADQTLDGRVNICAPNPLPNRDFMRALCQAWGALLGLSATHWMLVLGAFVMRTETELVLKSRRVVPRRLTEAGFEFQFPEWPDAAEDLVRRWRERAAAG